VSINALHSHLEEQIPRNQFFSSVQKYIPTVDYSSPNCVLDILYIISARICTFLVALYVLFTQIGHGRNRF